MAPPTLSASEPPPLTSPAGTAEAAADGEADAVETRVGLAGGGVRLWEKHVVFRHHGNRHLVLRNRDEITSWVGLWLVLHQDPLPPIRPFG